MYEFEHDIEPLDIEFPDGSQLRLVAGYPDGLPEPSGPFDLTPPVPVFGPVALRAAPGTLAMFFNTRPRAVTEGPRRTGLGENVLVCAGSFQDARLGEGLDPVDAPGWMVAGTPLALTAHFAFPLAGRGVDAASEIMFRRPDGRAQLMSAEQRQSLRDAAAEAFAKFLSDNPGSPDFLERALAMMDARIMRFEGERLRDVADREASMLEQGAEVLEEASGFEAGSRPVP